MRNVTEGTPDRPPSIWRLILLALGRLPERGMSRSFGRIADLPIPRSLRAILLTTFARAVGIDLKEVERPLAEYPTLNAFFVRRLRPGSRSWPADTAAIVSPVDGILGRIGRIEGGTAIQAKGHSYAIGDLLNASEDVSRYDGGAFITIYLSPRHYHRIHTPCAGTIPSATYVPGALLPVNAPAVMHLPGLFIRNERLICSIDGAKGRVAVVAVGAYNVGRISAAFDPEWSGTGRESWITNRRQASALRRSYSPPKRVDAGAEIMAFHLGSTVVMLFEPGVQIRDDVRAGEEVRVGQRIGN